ncbi:heavy-metal-associated domain-containing protein [Nocardia thailandica]|uniref:Heavy metal-associated domain-containing protein n=1 Tax=Nocardia thailandica TaxID=257275 RepID=A0ABW6PGU2_9NOCA|nr:heavy metal-associated domain-containing protein [Nocardia thailandica]
MSTTTLTVTGMTCGCCAGKVRSKVGDLPGVTAVDVDVDAGLVTVTAAATPSREALATAIDAAGFALADTE